MTVCAAYERFKRFFPVFNPELLKQKRIEAGKSQLRLAQEINITQPAYNYIESGKNEPKSGTLARLATALRCEIGDFYDAPEETGTYSVVLDKKGKPKVKEEIGVQDAVQRLKDLHDARTKVLGVFDAVYNILYVPDAPIEANTEFRRFNKRVSQLRNVLEKEKGLIVSEVVHLEFMSKYPATIKKRRRIKD